MSAEQPREGKTFQLGKSVTVTVPEAVADQVTQALSEAFGRRTGRAKARRVPADRLSVDRIVDVAIEQMRERGYDAVTMRSIAQALETGPASLYAHVANRAELDQLVIGRVSSQWQVPDPDPEHWADQVRRSMRELLALYQAHPGVARCSMAMIPTTTETLMPTERMLALLDAGGVPQQYAAWFVDVMALVVGAVAMEEDIWRQRAAESAGGARAAASEDEIVAQVHEVFASLPAQHFPMLSSMADALTTGSGEERFDFALDLLVSGLQALSARQ